MRSGKELLASASELSGQLIGNIGLDEPRVTCSMGPTDNGGPSREAAGAYTLMLVSKSSEPTNRTHILQDQTL